MKNRASGAILEPFGDPRGGPGVSEGTSGRFWRDLVEIFGEVGAKIGPRWAKLAASCAQDDP